MTRNLFSAIVVLIASLSTTTVFASDHCKADADIKDVCGQIIADPAGLRVNLNFKVKIEDARPGEPFDLVMSLKEKGCQVVDEGGQPVQFVVPLVMPDGCRDKFVFQSGLQSQLGRCSISCPSDVKICAEVFSAGSGKVLDKENEGLKFINNVPPPVVHHVVRTERVYYSPPPVVRHVEIIQPAPVFIQPAPVIVHRRVYVAPRPVRQINVGVGVGVGHGVGVDVHYSQSRD
jgi:hypothetical protein